ncbi:MAG TPA: DNA gyrase modulator, partial [Gammaproteobacteria bacterium]|nr:DNA gyrase modulator [Gammaproteobacteria bacterium]
MSTAIEIARQNILEPSGLGENELGSVLSSLLGSAIDSGDLYFQLSRHEGWSLEDRTVKGASFSIQRGVGVRAMSGEKTGFAYSDDIVLPALMDATKAARAIARGTQSGQLSAWGGKPG